MKLLQAMQVLVVGALVLSPLAQAREEFRTECWFKADDKECAKCHVQITEELDLRESSCFPIVITVDCDNGFELRDEQGKEFSRDGREINVGVETHEEKYALVDVKGGPTRGHEGDDREAILTISGERGAHRLDGSCRTTPIVPVP